MTSSNALKCVVSDNYVKERPISKSVPIVTNKGIALIQTRDSIIEQMQFIHTKLDILTKVFVETPKLSVEIEKILWSIEINYPEIKEKRKGIPPVTKVTGILPTILWNKLKLKQASLDIIKGIG